MKNFFSISQAAKIVGMTTETLRHYDRIELVKPLKRDEWTGYRYYSQQEIVRLNTIKALRLMDLTLFKIKDILAYDDFNGIVMSLKQAEKNADKKIAELKLAKSKIQLARTFYENKLSGVQREEKIYTKIYNERVILLSEKMEKPTLNNLWDYHRHFYNQIPSNLEKQFSFEDMAGVFEENGQSRLFAICTRYSNIEGIKFLPQGRYLCADCNEETRQQVIEKLLETAAKRYNVTPEFRVELIVLSGILQWKYQVQIYLP